MAIYVVRILEPEFTPDESDAELPEEERLAPRAEQTYEYEVEADDILSALHLARREHNTTVTYGSAAWDHILYAAVR